MKLQRMFSIQSGQPDQGGSLSRELKAKAGAGAIAGGALGVIPGAYIGLTAAAEGDNGLKWGAGIVGASAIVCAIAGALTVLGSKRRLSEAIDSDMNSLLDYLYNVDKANAGAGLKNIKDINLERYIQEDQDPRNYMVSFGYDKGILVINLNKPTDKLIKSMNESLESMIRFNRRADYTSETTKDGFMVYVVVPSIDAAAGLIYNVIAENKIKVNALTTKSLKKTKKFSEQERQKEFAKKKSLRDVESNKGLKRAILTSGITGGGSLVGGYLGKEAANQADDEGKTDEQIIRAAKDKGLKTGALTGAAVGTLGALHSTKGAAGGIVLGGALGALGGRNAAGVNTKDRLRKRAGVNY